MHLCATVQILCSGNFRAAEWHLGFIEDSEVKDKWKRETLIYFWICISNYTHTHTHTNTHMHLHTHAHMHTHTHSHSHSYTHIQTLTHTMQLPPNLCQNHAVFWQQIYLVLLQRYNVFSVSSLLMFVNVTFTRSVTVSAEEMGWWVGWLTNCLFCRRDYWSMSWVVDRVLIVLRKKIMCALYDL